MRTCFDAMNCIARRDSTAYAPVYGQITVQRASAKRHGVEPVATLTISGTDRHTTAMAEQIEVEVSVERLPGGDKIVEVSLSADGSHEVRNTDAFGQSAKRASTVRFAELGTSFVAARVTAHRDGDANSDFGRLPNHSRVRVVVHD